MILIKALILATALSFSDSYWTEGVGGKRYADWIKVTSPPKHRVRVGGWLETGRFFRVNLDQGDGFSYRFQAQGPVAAGIKITIDF